jgi:hypothetical protein
MAPDEYDHLRESADADLAQSSNVKPDDPVGFVLVDEVNMQAYGLFWTKEAAEAAAATGKFYNPSATSALVIETEPWGSPHEPYTNAWHVMTWQDYADRGSYYDYSDLESARFVEPGLVLHRDGRVDEASAKVAEAKLIADTELEIEAAQYRALHNRLEDFTTWMTAADRRWPSWQDSRLSGERSSFDEYMFEFIEAYLDQVIEHEDTHPVEQIVHPDLDDNEV